MESTSVRNRIQLSQATANLLMKAGKGSWIVKRSGEVEAKGKGRMQTFWLKCSVSFPILKPKLEESTEQEPTASESEDASTRGKESDDESSQDKGSVNASSQDKGSDSEKLEE